MTGDGRVTVHSSNKNSTNKSLTLRDDGDPPRLISGDYSWIFFGSSKSQLGKTIATGNKEMRLYILSDI